MASLSVNCPAVASMREWTSWRSAMCTSCFSSRNGVAAVGASPCRAVRLELRKGLRLMMRRRNVVVLSTSDFSSSSGQGVEEAESPWDGNAFGDGSVFNREDSKSQVMNEVLQRLSEQDLEVAAKKYNYEDELFAQIDYAQINAFARKAFQGNPAAVCFLPYVRDDNWLKLIAKEFNLPATAFVVKRRRTESSPSAGSERSPLVGADETGKGLKSVQRKRLPEENEFDIRCFTPGNEVDLCGHATLASAHMLFSSGIVEGDTIIFHGKKGKLKASKVSGYDDEDTADLVENGEKPQPEKLPKRAELGKGVVELDFPMNKPVEVGDVESGKVSEAVGVTPLWIGKNDLGDYLAELASSEELQQLKPDLQKVKDLGGRGLIVTARAPASSEFDVVSRFFAPNLGVMEDPVTGSAHTTIGPYWANRLGKETLNAYQASERGGQIKVRVDEVGRRVYLQGGAVLVMAGTLLNTFDA